MAILRRRSGKVRKLVPVRIAVAVMPAGIGELNRARGQSLPPCSFAVSGCGESSGTVSAFLFCPTEAVRTVPGRAALADR